MTNTPNPPATRAPRGVDQPTYTEARGRHWEIWLKVAVSGPRRRVKTWIEVRHDRASGALLGGAEARAIHDEVSKLWNSRSPRWEILQHVARPGAVLTLQALYDTLIDEGLAGADALMDRCRADHEADRAVDDAMSDASARVTEPDLIPLVEEWELSPMDRQDGMGSISARTRTQMVSRIMRLLSPETLAWRQARSLAYRDRRTPPCRPDVRPFPVSAFSTERIRQHLLDSYTLEPNEQQAELLSDADPTIRTLTANSLKGQGDGAVAAFNALRVFTRWLITRGLLTMDPLGGLKRPRASQSKITKLECTADIELLASRLSKPFDDVWRVMCGTGFEPTVALTLRVADVDGKSQESIGNGTKNRLRVRRAEASPLAGNALLRAVTAAKQEGRAAVWPSETEHGNVVTRFALAKAVSAAASALVSEGHAQFEGLTPYSGRHTFCVMALQGGATMQDVANQLGHKDTTMVMRLYGVWEPRQGRIRAALSGNETVADAE